MEITCVFVGPETPAVVAFKVRLGALSYLPPPPTEDRDRPARTELRGEKVSKNRDE